MVNPMLEGEINSFLAESCVTGSGNKHNEKTPKRVLGKVGWLFSYFDTLDRNGDFERELIC